MGDSQGVAILDLIADALRLGGCEHNVHSEVSLSRMAVLLIAQHLLLIPDRLDGTVNESGHKLRTTT